MPRSVTEHLEHYLGEICHGWSDDRSVHAFQVVSFKDQPVEGIVTYSTLGLSEMELALPRGSQIRQELVLSAHESIPAEEIVHLLLTCAERLGKRGKAVLRGEVIDLSRPLVRGATTRAVYATNPTPFDDGFAEFSHVNPPVIFVLLVPVTAAEAKLIGEEGWSRFEDWLEAQDPDIWDLSRTVEVCRP
ncbi:suppressor of fused domain protein [Massilia sp. MB5]|uniref:suppressor of fused domain protein n=1 Tax=Massilia sp. MB5 TaxID=2919578 RepID=UPI001F0F1D6A|nr:suppressor of fused domain protein [Massilia sp. MB5]UMR30066.1 suppressor of fused domain protein [Massilia sp. MB5]